MIRFLLPLLAVGGFLLTPQAAARAGAHPESAQRSRLDRLQKELLRLEDEDRDLSGREAGVLAELDRLTAARDLAAARAQVARKAMEAAVLELQRAAEKAAEADIIQVQARERLARRLRTMERHGPGVWLAVLVRAEDPVAARGTLEALADRARMDLEAAARARDSGRQARFLRAGLEATRVEVETMRRKALRAGEGARQALERQRSRLEAVRSRRDLVRQASREMARAAQEMDDYLSGRRRRAPRGPDLLTLKGTLRWPVRGRVKVPFGPRRHPRFGTLLPHQGLDIGAPPGSKVRAVLPGEVIFSGWFKGYGRTVIVDHGAHLVTISAHLDRLEVDVGTRVEAGQSLGTVGDSGSLEGPGLYFEMRQDGEPIPPRSWLALAPQANRG
ncbi:MAG: murein hydrolase activator EnvC family protein [Acidobacteriota bacterium]